jgi:hypothetical protein
MILIFFGCAAPDQAANRVLMKVVAPAIFKNGGRLGRRKKLDRVLLFLKRKRDLRDESAGKY